MLLKRSFYQQCFGLEFKKLIGAMLLNKFSPPGDSRRMSINRKK